MRGVRIDPEFLAKLIHMRVVQRMSHRQIEAATGINRSSLSKYLHGLDLTSDERDERQADNGIKAAAARYDHRRRFVFPIPALEVQRDRLKRDERETVNIAIVCAHLEALQVPHTILDEVTIEATRPGGERGILIIRSANSKREFGHPCIKVAGGVRQRFVHREPAWVAYLGVLLETGSVYCLPMKNIAGLQMVSCRPDFHGAWSTLGFQDIDPNDTAAADRCAISLLRNVPVVIDALVRADRLMTSLTRQTCITPTDVDQRPGTLSQVRATRLTSHRHRDGFVADVALPRGPVRRRPRPLDATILEQNARRRGER